jgi:hypothetical protein
VYLILFPMRTGSEIAVLRHWAADTYSAVATDSGAPVVSVVTADALAYFDADGQLTFRTPRAYSVAATSSRFINASQNPDQLVLQRADGSFVGTIPDSGYPAAVDDTLFVLGPEGSYLKAIEDDSSVGWQVQTPAVVTSLAVDSGLMAAGLLSGGVLAVASDGTQFPVEGSDTLGRTVFGVGVHAASRSISVVAGHVESTLTVFQRIEESFVPTLRVPALAEIGAQVYVGFTPSGRHVVTGDQGVRVVNSETGESTSLHSDLRLTNVAFSPTEDFHLAFLTGDDEDPQHGFQKPGELLLFDPDGLLLARVRFWAGSSTLSAAERRMFLHRDSRLLCFEVLVE